jgi:hypothetical protein
LPRSLHGYVVAIDVKRCDPSEDSSKTAGKDRTGLIVVIVLLLLGAPDDAIIRDYTLTTAGLQPALLFLIARFKDKPGYSQNWKGLANMGSAK